MRLEDISAKSGLTNTWENVQDIVARYTERGQWLGKEEKRFSESIPKPRAGLEDHRPRARETMSKKGIDVTAVEQMLKDMENLKIAMVKKSEDQRTVGGYGAIAPIHMIGRIVMSTSRRYDGISSGTREIRFIRWTLISHFSQNSEKAA